jgi:nucleoside 2-deoxyribosyltransferase
MTINYADKPVIKECKSIFLAGPTPRSPEVPSWRPDAIEILEKLRFEGVVYVPERESGERNCDHTLQAVWEREALYNADVIVFWVPRNLPTMPAFTTNVEFGYWIAKDKDKVLYGRPNESEKKDYIDWLYKLESERTPISNLETLLQEAIKMVTQKNS